MYQKLILSGLVAGTLVACGTLNTTNGIVAIGQDMYMINGSVYLSNYDSAMKARFFQQAAQFCTDRTRVMVPANTSNVDTKLGESSAKELQFYCLLDSDPRLRQ
ncbi:MAG: hypothetical protein K2P84_01495 [Undibacterium sp.]|nr:hypothetical protein [Undibacterium sp.]